MLLGENKEISSTTHQTLQNKKNNPKIWIPQLNMPSCHRERISEKKKHNYSEEVDTFPRTHLAQCVHSTVPFTNIDEIVNVLFLLSFSWSWASKRFEESATPLMHFLSPTLQIPNIPNYVSRLISCHQIIAK